MRWRQPLVRSVRLRASTGRSTLFIPRMTRGGSRTPSSHSFHCIVPTTALRGTFSHEPSRTWEETCRRLQDRAAEAARGLVWRFRVHSKITSDFGGSATGPNARREEGAGPRGPVTDEQRSSWPGAAPPLRAGAIWLAGFVSHSSQATSGMLLVRASPASQIASSKIGIYF